MSRVKWNQPGARTFEAGVDRGVFYPRLGEGVPWNGLVSIAENSSGGEVEALYYDGVKMRDVVSSEDFEAVVEAFTTPPEFAVADGQRQLSPGLFVTQQPRQSFGLSYRTLKGNDLMSTEYGYKLHLVYNCTAAPSSRTYSTLGQSSTPGTRSWTLHTVPPHASTYKPTAHLVVDSTLVDPYLMEDLETLLYGRDASEGQFAIPAHLPEVSEIIRILSNPISEFIEEYI